MNAGVIIAGLFGIAVLSKRNRLPRYPSNVIDVIDQESASIKPDQRPGSSSASVTPDASMANAPASAVPSSVDRWAHAQALVNQARRSAQLRLSNTTTPLTAARVAMSTWPELATDGRPGPQTLSAIQSLYAFHRAVLPFDPWSAAPPVTLSDIQGAANDVTRGRVVAVASSLLRWARASR